MNWYGDVPAMRPSEPSGTMRMLSELKCGAKASTIQYGEMYMPASATLAVITPRVAMNELAHR